MRKIHSVYTLLLQILYTAICKNVLFLILQYKLEIAITKKITSYLLPYSVYFNLTYKNSKTKTKIDKPKLFLFNRLLLLLLNLSLTLRMCYIISKTKI